MSCVRKFLIFKTNNILNQLFTNSLWFLGPLCCALISTQHFALPSSELPPPFYCGSTHTWPSQIRALENQRAERKAGYVVETRGRVFGRRGLSAFRWSKKLMTALLCCEKAGQRKSVTGNHALCQWTVTKEGRTYGTLSFNHIYIAYMLALCSAHSANNVTVFVLAKRM